jgi:CRP-like cAMP-binding protein
MAAHKLSLKAAMTKVQTLNKLGMGDIFVDADEMAEPDRQVFGQPLFKDCRPDFLKLLLRELRLFEFEVHGISTWLDENEQIFKVSALAPDQLPPYMPKVVGQQFNYDDYLCSYDDYGIDLIVVISGKVEKIISGHIMQVLGAGDAEGVNEFLGWTTRRKCTLRIAEEGTRVRFLSREILLKVLDRTHQVPKAVESDEDEEEEEEEGENGGDADDANEDDPPPEEDAEGLEEEAEISQDENQEEQFEDVYTWDFERELFSKLTPDQVDAVSPSEVLAMSFWGPLDHQSRESFQGLCFEERYYLPGQYIIRSHTDADCAVIFLRGTGAFEEQEVADKEASSWLYQGYVVKDKKKVGSHRKTRVVRQVVTFNKQEMQGTSSAHVAGGGESRGLGHTVVPGVVPEDDFIEVKSGTVIGALSLVGGQVQIGGLIKARTPVLVAIVWHHIFKDFLSGQSPELKRRMPDARQRTAFFESEPLHEARFFHRGNVDAALTKIRKKYELEEKLKKAGKQRHPPTPAQGPAGRSPSPSRRGRNLKPGRSAIGELMEQRSPRAVLDNTGQPLAGTSDGFHSHMSQYKGQGAYDALRLVLLHSFQNHNLLNEILDNAPQQLLESLIAAFEPRWCVPGQVIVMDEEEYEALFVFLYGDFTVHVAGADVAELSQGAIQGEAQLLGLLPWTRTIRAAERNKTEALVMVLTRERFVLEMKGTREDAKFPVPTKRLIEIEGRLRDEVPSRGEDGWQVIAGVPMFKSCGKKFIKRLYQDADVAFLCPGEAVALEGEVAASMVVVVAGKLRAEQHKTLYCVEYGRGQGLSNWCFQNNFLGNDFYRCFDLVAVTHTIVLFLYRHTLLQCLIEFPKIRPIISGMQTWIENAATMTSHRIFQGSSPELLEALEAVAEPRACSANQCLLPADMPMSEGGFFFVQRGHAKVELYGETTQELFQGDGTGTLQLFGAEVSNLGAINAVTPCDALFLSRAAFVEVLGQDRFEEERIRFDNMCRSLIEAGEPEESVQKASVFEGCSERFIKLVSPLVEDQLYWPGQTLFQQGEEGSTMYIIHVGEARLEMTGVGVVGTVPEGSCTGEQTALGIEPSRTVTARATAITWARVLRRPLLDKAKRWFEIDGDIMVENSSGKKISGPAGISSEE